MGSAPDAAPQIAALYVYPVKGCAGVALDRCAVTVRGLGAPIAPVTDREFMLVDVGGRFVSQRELPGLARVRPSVTPGKLELAVDGDRLTIPLAARAWANSARCEVVVWKDRIPALDAGDGPAGWLSERTGTPVRLVRFDHTVTRPCDPVWVGASGAHTAFADGFPVLVIGAQTLAELQCRMGAASPLPMNRFRPNIVVSGLPAGDEDHVASITVGEVVLDLVKPCTRCRVTAIDQETGAPGLDPLPALASYRHDPRLGGVTFGMNAIVRGGAGVELAVGATAHCDYRF